MNTLRLVLALLLCVPNLRAVAQTATPPPTSAPTSAPTEHQETEVWHNPPHTPWSIFDPCGGPKELLSKIGPSPCVLIKGEAELSAGYTNFNTHGNVQITGGGPIGLGTNVPISGNANAYPQLLMIVGVSPSSHVQITLPSSVDVNTQRFGTVNETSDPAFDYRQRLYFSQTKYTQLSLDLGYIAPIEGGGINSPGPTYQIQLLFAQPLSENFTFGGWWTFQNANTATPTQGSHRVWSDPLGLYLAWSPVRSGFMLLPIIYHEFNPNKTVFAGQAMQLLGRHFAVSVAYGGLGTSSQGFGPFAHVVRFAANTNPRVFSVNIYDLIGESNLPPMPAKEPHPAPTPTSTP